MLNGLVKWVAGPLRHSKPCEWRIRDEASDEVKINVLTAVGAWLQHAASLPSVVAKRLADSLKEKDSLKGAALAAVLQVGDVGYSRQFKRL